MHKLKKANTEKVGCSLTIVFGAVLLIMALYMSLKSSSDYLVWFVIILIAAFPMLLVATGAIETLRK